MLDAILSPKTVAVVGASRSEGSAGWRVVHRLLESHFDGAIIPVNARHADVLGRRCVPSVAEAGDVDLAVLTLPRAEVLEVGAAIEAGARAIVVVTAGLEAHARAALAARCAEAGVVLLGPESYGLGVPAARLDTTVRVGPLLRDGGLAVVSASGRAAAPVVDQLAERGVGLRLFADLGEQAGLGVPELALALAEDESTKAIAIYGWQPGVDTPTHWLSQIATRKPVVVYAPELGQVELTLGGQAGAERRAVDVPAMLRARGIQVVGSPRSLVGLGAALAAEPRAQGRGVLVVAETNLAAQAAARALESRGLELPELGAEVEARVRSEVRPEARATNPIVLTNAATGRHVDVALDAGLSRPEVHAAVILAQAADSGFVHHDSGKPVLGVGAPPVESFDDAARALDALAGFAQLAPSMGEVVRPGDLASDAPGRIQALVAGAALTRRRSLTASDALRALASYGVRTTSSITVGSAVSAQRAAAELGYPVVLKAASSRGRRRVGPLEDAAAVEAALTGLVTELGPSDPHLWLAIEPVIPGTNFELSFARAPWLGPVAMLKAEGGVGSVHAAPLNRTAAEAIVAATLGPGAEIRDTLAELLWRVSTLASDFPELTEIRVAPIGIDARGVAAASDAVVGFADLL